MPIGELPALMLAGVMAIAGPAALLAVAIMYVRYCALPKMAKGRLRPLPPPMAGSPASLKGQAGEKQVNATIRNHLDPAAYRLLPNVMLPTPGGTTQIDHVIVSPFGIFVIETKNMKGWIFGNERDKAWTQKLFNGTHRFQNPLRQNYRHTKTLSDVTCLPHDYFTSVVVFTGTAEIKTPMPANVVTLQDLVWYILSHQTPVFGNDQVAHLAGLIQGWASTVSEEKARQHVANLKLNHTPVSTRSRPPICQRCGKRMVLRTYRKDASQFWGCSDYPRCRGTKKAVHCLASTPVGAAR